MSRIDTTKVIHNARADDIASCRVIPPQDDAYTHALMLKYWKFTLSILTDTVIFSSTIRSYLLISGLAFYGVRAGPYVKLNARNGAPLAQLDSAAVTGVTVNSGSIEQFLGIPFALPPAMA